uniref:Uncharacterized protein n=1 Tax=Anopheles atroparvus TaxID=41427 RepID=A0A182JA07_ANOAO
LAAVKPSFYSTAKMNKLIITFVLASVCAMLLVSYASAEHHKPDEKLVPIDNMPEELKMPLEGILDGLRVRREAQADQGQGQGNAGRRGPPSGGQGGQQSGQNNGGN